MINERMHQMSKQNNLGQTFFAILFFPLPMVVVGLVHSTMGLWGECSTTVLPNMGKL
jgi:hypothetical protein